jgi:hypothetical protein
MLPDGAKFEMIEVHEAKAWIAPQLRHRRREKVFGHEVVCIQAGRETSGNVLQTSISRRGEAGVLRKRNQLKARAFDTGNVSPPFHRKGFGRSVVDEDQFEVLIRLIPQAQQQVWKVDPIVMTRDHTSNPGIPRRSSASNPRHRLFPFLVGRSLESTKKPGRASSFPNLPDLDPRCPRQFEHLASHFRTQRRDRFQGRLPRA